MNQPLRRHESLQPLSRDHHHALLLCWKIRKGISSGVNPDRIKNYASWFFSNHLLPHFEVEEKYLFPILGNQHELVRKALEQHRMIESLITGNDAGVDTLSTLADLLDNHIRFEERELFGEIQKGATEEQMKMVESVHHEEAFIDNTEDAFWL